jgi:glycosyltransferase involved in cell wall biosynthesis
MSTPRQPRICIATPKGRDGAETFVRAHIDLLPGEKVVLHGPSCERVDGGRSIACPLWARALGRMLPGSLQARLISRALAAAVGRFLARNRVDVVLAEFGHVGVRAFPACRAAGVPLVVHFHGYDAYTDYMLAEYGGAYRQMLPHCAAVIAGCEEMVEHLVELGAPRAGVAVNPGGGVDCSVFSGAEPEQAPPVFVAVGRFVEKKAPHLTVMAFRRVLDACPEARLVMIGDGDLMPVCADLAAALDMAHAVEFPGSLPHREVAARMRGARAFVQHSVRAANGDSEGTAIAPREAGGCGLPVVATRHAGIPEAVVDGETGFLVDERDVGAMADRMLRLATDPARAQRMGRAARQRVCRDFTVAQCIEGLHRILVEAAGIA